MLEIRTRVGLEIGCLGAGSLLGGVRQSSVQLGGKDLGRRALETELSLEKEQTVRHDEPDVLLLLLDTAGIGLPLTV